MDPEKELREVFRVFDKDKDGFISPTDLFEILSKLGEKISRVSDLDIATAKAEAGRNGR